MSDVPLYRERGRPLEEGVRDVDRVVRFCLLRVPAVDPPPCFGVQGFTPKVTTSAPASSTLNIVSLFKRSLRLSPSNSHIFKTVSQELCPSDVRLCLLRVPAVDPPPCLAL